MTTINECCSCSFTMTRRLTAFDEGMMKFRRNRTIIAGRWPRCVTMPLCLKMNPRKSLAFSSLFQSYYPSYFSVCRGSALGKESMCCQVLAPAHSLHSSCSLFIALTSEKHAEWRERLLPRKWPSPSYWKQQKTKESGSIKVRSLHFTRTLAALVTGGAKFKRIGHREGRVVLCFRRCDEIPKIGYSAFASVL